MNIDLAKSLFDRLLSIWGRGETDALKTIYHPDFIGHIGGNSLSREMLFKRHDYSLRRYKNYNSKCLGLTQVSSSLYLALSKQYAFDNFLNERAILYISTLFEIKSDSIIKSWTVFSNHVDLSLSHFEDFTLSLERKKNLNDFIEAYKTNTSSNSFVLTKREFDCLHLYLMSLTSKDIAKNLTISPKTVDTYLARIKDKFGVNRLSELRQLISF